MLIYTYQILSNGAELMTHVPQQAVSLKALLNQEKDGCVVITAQNVGILRGVDHDVGQSPSLPLKNGRFWQAGSCGQLVLCFSQMVIKPQPDTKRGKKIFCLNGLIAERILETKVMHARVEVRYHKRANSQLIAVVEHKCYRLINTLLCETE